MADINITSNLVARLFVFIRIHRSISRESCARSSPPCRGCFHVALRELSNRMIRILDYQSTNLAARNFFLRNSGMISDRKNLSPWILSFFDERSKRKNESEIYFFDAFLISFFFAEHFNENVKDADR